MSLGDFLRKQFIDVIQWTESGPGVLMYRFPMQDMEIQSGAKLTVRDSQLALFVNEGRAADAFTPGLHTLVTSNLPILTNLLNWDKAFESPFKSDVYFFSTRLQTGQRWGTQQPITIRDREFGAVRLRAFGMYGFRVANPAVFQQNVGATDAEYTVTQLEPALRNAIISGFTSAFANAQVPFLDMAANQAQLATQIAASVQPAFEQLGLKLESFTVENLSLPDELQKRLDERISMNIIGDMRTYTQFQAAQSIPIAAANEGGMAGLAAGLGAGVGLGGAIANALSGAAGAPQSPGVAVPPERMAPPVSPTADAKFCTNCGTRIPSIAKFCSACGTAQT
ncbi:MAG TPA: SPFH domain-containing protein [Gemmatimonas sp.]|uniref:SPFH domain-containing protein n=1 Tax=Gemmatimonas sp. TaxID=1962908 RepID=UPI002ED85BAF